MIRHGGEPDEAARFIEANLRLRPVPAVPEISIRVPDPGSGLWRLLDQDESRGGEMAPPYWAYAWAGGAVLARYLLDNPHAVADRSVLDLGAGSGLVGIAAAKAGASKVYAAEIDANGIAALGLNAAANGVEIVPIHEDLTTGPPPSVDVVVVGDLFYAPDLAQRVASFLDRCVAGGISVLVGDPRRAFLPLDRLELLAEYTVPDFGDNPDQVARTSGVFSFQRQAGL